MVVTTLLLRRLGAPTRTCRTSEHRSPTKWSVRGAAGHPGARPKRPIHEPKGAAPPRRGAGRDVRRLQPSYLTGLETATGHPPLGRGDGQTAEHSRSGTARQARNTSRGAALVPKAKSQNAATPMGGASAGRGGPERGSVV